MTSSSFGLLSQPLGRTELHDIEMELLQMVIGMWVTIRGFSNASDWVEKFKLLEKKTKQKSKGIRKTLYID